jgi:hypothetical protein
MTPSRTDETEKRIEHTEEVENMGEDNPETLWRMDDVPGKGKGLFATRDLIPGTLLLRDPPLITTDCILSMESAEKDIGRALKKLPVDSRRAYLALHNNFPGAKHILQNIIRSNGYPLGPNSDSGGIFLYLSRFNHSCRPNAKHSWNEKLGVYTVYTLRPVQQGEELTLSYLKGGVSSERQQELKEHFMFTCSCEVCSLPADQLKASDARLLRAASLDRTIGNWDSARDSPAKVLANGRKLLSIYREEQILDDRLANLYWDVFQVVIMHGDEARASEFARMYCQLKTLSEGPDSGNLEDVLPFVSDPKSQRNYGELMDWKSDVEDVPRGLDEEAFEKWLWREDA